MSLSRRTSKHSHTPAHLPLRSPHGIKLSTINAARAGTKSSPRDQKQGPRRAQETTGIRADLAAAAQKDRGSPWCCAEQKRQCIRVCIVLSSLEAEPHRARTTGFTKPTVQAATAEPPTTAGVHCSSAWVDTAGAAYTTKQPLTTHIHTTHQATNCTQLKQEVSQRFARRLHLRCTQPTDSCSCGAHPDCAGCPSLYTCTPQMHACWHAMHRSTNLFEPSHCQTPNIYY